MSSEDLMAVSELIAKDVLTKAGHAARVARFNRKRHYQRMQQREQVDRRSQDEAR